MDTVTLQIPMPKSLKKEAMQIVDGSGFSSLQEVVRVFLTQLVKKQITFSFLSSERLSSKAERRYLKLLKDINEGKNVTKTRNLDELFTSLDEN